MIFSSLQNHWEGGRRRFNVELQSHCRGGLKTTPRLLLLKLSARNTSPLQRHCCLQHEATSASGAEPAPPRPDAFAATGVNQRDSFGRAWFLTLSTLSFLGQNPMWICIMTELGHSPTP